VECREELEVVSRTREVGNLRLFGGVLFSLDHRWTAGTPHWREERERTKGGGRVRNKGRG
jgi:hypothetical protein